MCQFWLRKLGKSLGCKKAPGMWRTADSPHAVARRPQACNTGVLFVRVALADAQMEIAPCGAISVFVSLPSSARRPGTPRRIRYQGYRPRTWRACRMRVQATMNAAVRSVTLCSLATCDTDA